MTEIKKYDVIAAYRSQKVLQLGLPDFENNRAFAASLAEQLRRLPTDSRVNAMMEILNILNQFVRVETQTEAQ